MDNDTKPAGLGCNEGLGPASEAHKLTDDQIANMAFAVLRAYNDDRLWRALSYSSGPYEVAMPTVALCHLARVFFAAGLNAARSEDWRQKAAAWLRAKADAQEKTNRDYPEHTKAYPSWEKRVRDLRWDADEMEGKFGSYGAPGPNRD